MTRFLPGISVAVLATAFSLAGLAQAVAASVFMPKVAASRPEIVRISDSANGLPPEGARIIRRDRHREHRIERSERPHGDGYRVEHRRNHDKRFAYRHHQNDRLGYNRAREGGVRLGYNRSLDSGRYAYNHRPYRHWDKGRHERPDFYGDNWNQGEGYRYKRRVYKMESFGYQPAPHQGPLKDILTAVPK